MNEVSAIKCYCLIDDIIKNNYSKRLQNQDQQIMSDTEVVFASILSAQWFSGNFRRGLLFISTQKYCLNILSEGRFLRRLKAIPMSIWSILQKALAIAAGGYKDGEFIIDSFPYPVCKNVRIHSCRIVKSPKYRGYNASKKEYFYGLKIHTITGINGIPITFDWTPGSEHDLTAFKNMNMESIDGGVLFADAAYNDYHLEDQLLKSGLKMIVARRKNSKRQHTLSDLKELSKKRKRIETTFSGIMKLFPRTIHAIKLDGLVLKMTLFIAGFTALYL